MTLSQYVRRHMELGRAYRFVARMSGAEEARRAWEKWEAWCPAAVAGYRTKGRG